MCYYNIDRLSPAAIIDHKIMTIVSDTENPNLQVKECMDWRKQSVKRRSASEMSIRLR